MRRTENQWAQTDRSFFDEEKRNLAASRDLLTDLLRAFKDSPDRNPLLSRNEADVEALVIRPEAALQPFGVLTAKRTFPSRLSDGS
jgi:hypothetical protein